MGGPAKGKRCGVLVCIWRPLRPFSFHSMHSVCAGKDTLVFRPTFPESFQMTTSYGSRSVYHKPRTTPFNVKSFIPLLPVFRGSCTDKTRFLFSAGTHSKVPPPHHEPLDPTTDPLSLQSVHTLKAHPYPEFRNCQEILLELA